MNNVMRKLRSCRGASMILAMVFMLFAVFIGGTILASAAANAYRVEHLSDQQIYLDQRSAALMIGDELTPDSGTDLAITILEIATSYQAVTISDGGVVEDVDPAPGEPVHSVTIKSPANLIMTPMQRIAVETAIGQYLEQSHVSISDITLSGFRYYDSTGDVKALTSISQFMMYSGSGSSESVGTYGTLSLSGTVNAAANGGTVTLSDELENGFDANFECCYGAQLYDFVVDFGNSSQLVVVMDGYSGTNNPVTTSQVTEVPTSISTSGYARVFTTTTRTAISWSKPEVEKGGN